MNIQNVSAAAPAFRANMTTSLLADHHHSIISTDDEIKSEALLKRLDNILPDYRLGAEYTLNHDIALTLSNYNRETQKQHTIELYNKLNKNETMGLENVKVNNMNKLVTKLEGMYGDQTPIKNNGLKVTNEQILNNPYAMRIMDILEHEELKALESSGWLKQPYQVTISSCNENEGKELTLASRVDSDDLEKGIYTTKPITVKENVKISLKTTDRANNMVTYDGFFYLPDDIGPSDDPEHWSGDFRNAITDLVINKYPEEIKKNHM